MLPEIINNYRNHYKTLVIADVLRDATAPKIHLKNLTGSSKSFYLSALFGNLERNFLLVLNEREEAAYFLNDIENITEHEHVLFFPSSFKRAYQIEDTDNANVLQRAEVLNKILEVQKPKFIITYAEALKEKVITRQNLSQNTLHVKVGTTLSIDFINEVLYSYEFERVDFVLEPGQFSIRGGIVDVFSYSNDYPYRIEFFGDEVDSIRSFDIVTQLSVKNFDKISLIPNVQGKAIREQRISFFEYLPKDTVIAFSDAIYTKDRLDKEFAAAKKIYEEHKAGIIEQLSPDELFINADLFEQICCDKSVIEFGSQAHFHVTKELEFEIQPQPSFNKNFELLQKNLIQNTESNIKNYIFTDTPKQAERIYQIFEDIPQKADEVSKTEFAPLAVSIFEGFIDNELKIACYTDHQIFERYHRFRLKEVAYKNKQAITLKELQSLQPGDFVTHIDHGVGRFAGLEKMEVNGKVQEAVRLVYKDNDVLYVSIHSLHRISKYAGSDGQVPKLNKLGSPAWQQLKQKTKKKVKEIAFDLIKLYAKRKALKGFAFSPDSYLQAELEASFIYEDTPDQLKTTIAVKKDMEAESPMDRLVCGDVGFGKTEIAVRAAFKAACDGKQVAVLVPTTILALQHYKTFSSRLKEFPVVVDYVNRFKSYKQEKDTLAKLAEGKVDILIGTHRLLGKDIKFKDLGLLIIDEEQKFGVGAKDKLKSLRAHIDNLTLTATPIPRTLQFSMMGARDLSVITTPPPNRYPVQTEVHTSNEELIRNAVSYELQRGGQVFFIHNRVGNILDMAGMIQRLVPDARVCIGHGQMDGDKLEETMLDFIDGRYDVLVATTIIESGLDIPNANTIIINHAENFGLSDLHQMRGRVGRSNKKAFCYLLTPPQTILSTEARKRLRALEEFSDLGSGFNIAMKDLDIRGAGNLLGAEQSGFINEIGFEMYQKIMDEAIQELKEEEFSELFQGKQGEVLKSNISNTPFLRSFVSDCVIETDLAVHFPTDYIENTEERLVLYKELDDVANEEKLKEYEAQLVDRFGPLPEEAKELLNIIRLRWLGKELGFEKILFKQQKLIGYFIAKTESPFYQSEAFTSVLQYLQANPRLCKMTEKNNKLSLSFNLPVKSIDEAIGTLRKIKGEL